jgi:hypothetical protein
MKKFDNDDIIELSLMLFCSLFIKELCGFVSLWRKL